MAKAGHQQQGMIQIGLPKPKWDRMTRSYTGGDPWRGSKVDPTPLVRIERLHCVRTGRGMKD